MRCPTSLPSTSGVYVIVCLITRKVYVGSSVCIRKRFNTHVHHLRRGSHSSRYLQRAWNKYGASAFECRVLDDCAPEDRIQWEQQYIDLYQSANPRYGYNLNPIAKDQTGRKWTPEQLQRASASQTGKKASEETKQKHRQAWEKNGDTWRMQRREKHGLTYDLISPDGERVTGKGITALARQIGVHHADLCRLVKGTRGTQSLKGWHRADYIEPPPYVMLDHYGTERIIPRKEWITFCRTNGLNPNHLRSVRTGLREHHHGWSAVTRKDAYVTIEHVDGRQVGVLPSAQDFVCKELGLNCGHLGRLLKGQVSSVKGWFLPSHVEYYRSFFRFYAPDGSLITLPWGTLRQWAATHDLDYHAILNVCQGSRKDYLGYRHYYLSLDAFHQATGGAKLCPR